MSDDVSITVRVNNQTASGFRNVNGQLRTLDGRFAATGENVRRSSSMMQRGMVDLRATMLSLAPAAVPVAASLAPIAVHAGAAGVAVAAFGAAVIPQIGNLKNAASAQDKYTAAVTKYGAGSKQALQAQQFMAESLAGMPKATQQAAAAYSNLRDKFHEFSDSTAKFTMAPVEKSFAVVGALLPKLAPMAQGTATQLNRLVTVAGGAVSTPGFDALSKKLSDFANNSLKSATDRAIHFMRVMSEGHASGPLMQFMAYAREQGPAVKDLLINLAQAAGNIAKGAAEAGPGMLSIVNALAKMAAAVPPQLIGNLMQVYTAFKLIKLAGAGVATVGGGIQSLAGKIATLQAASATAGGGLAGLKAAFMSLGTAAKATVVVAGVTALVLVLSKLSSIGKQAPPDVDRMTTALGNLGRTGRVSGEALRVFGSNLGGLADSLRTLSRPSNLDKTQQFLTSLIGMDSTPVKEAKTNLDAVDKALANMVKGGKADLAKVAFEDIAKAMQKQGLSSKELKGKLDDYKSALADQALEAKLTAESMGLFGQQAQDVQAKLEAQKASADGLRQSLQALNDVNRQGLGGMIGFEAAIDAAAKAAKDNHDALSMTNGVLNLGSEKARNAASALQDLADKTDSAAASARESGSSWETVNGIYSRGRSQLIKSAEAMGLTGEQARQLADQILKIPDKTAKIKMSDADAVAGLNSFNAALRRSPGSKSVTLKTLSSAAEQVLASFGYKVTHLKNGSVRVSAATGQALSAIGNVQGAVNSLHGKTITIMTQYFTAKSPAQLAAAHGRAHGGLAPGYADGGQVVQTHPNGGLISGPGTGTSDSILEMSPNGGMYRTSNREYIVQESAVRKYGVGLLDSLNAGRLKLAGYARGGVTKAEQQARNDAAGDLSISRFGWMAGYRKDEFNHAMATPDSVGSLVSALNQWRGIIQKATHGRTESRLLHQLDSTGRSLLKYENKLNSVTKSLDAAKTKLTDLKNAASQLSDSVKSNILSSANITRGASGDAPVTTKSVMAGLTQSRDKATSFANALKQLKKKGLSSALIQQIAEAGIEGGGLETAGALLGASSSEIKSMNSLQGQINSAAGSAGKTTADSVYGAQIKAQQQYVKTLERSQALLKKSMDRLASTMERAIKSAFGRKASGGVVGAAATGGVRGGLTWVGEHEPELLDLPIGSRVWSGPDSRRKTVPPWASMMTTRAGRAAYEHRAGGGQPIVVHQTITLDGRTVAQQIFEPLRAEIAHRGGSVQNTLGQRGR